MRSCAVALVMLVACRSSAVPALPSQGGPAWIELTSPHFTLWTDTSDTRARELMTEMEHLRQALIGAAFQNVEHETRVFVVAVRDDDELHAYMPEQFEAMAFPPQGDAIRQALVVLPATRSRGGEEHVEAHELTHVISYAIIHDQPRWFAEGLAKYFETIKLGDTGFDIGAQPYQRPGTVIRRPASLHTILACHALACADGSFYAAAWLLMTYLHNAHPAELAHYMQLLVDGHGDRAFGEAFTMPVDDLEIELKQWIDAGHHTVLHYNINFRPFSVATRPLGEADVHAARALLASHVARYSQQRVFAEIDASLAIEPTNVLANTLARALGRPPKPEATHAIAAAHPDDWRAWWLVSLADKSDPTALDKACALARANPAVELPKECPPPTPRAPSTPPESPPSPPSN